MSAFGTKQTLRGSVPMSVMDGMIRMVYGANPPPKSADIERSITIAHEDLLFEKVPLSEVKRTAGELFKGPVPYSTHDLAVSPRIRLRSASGDVFRNTEISSAHKSSRSRNLLRSRIASLQSLINIFWR